MPMELKKSQLAKIYLYTGLVVLSLALTGSLYVWSQKLVEKSGWLQNEISSQNQNITRARNDANDFQQAVNTWNNLNASQKQKQGVNIDKARELIDQLKIKYRIQRIDVNMTSPIINNDIRRKNGTKDFQIEESIVKINFDTITDIYALSFINALAKQLPGFVKITDVKLERVGQVNPAILEKIAQGTFPVLVKGKMDFIWQDFKPEPPKVETHG